MPNFGMPGVHWIEENTELTEDVSLSSSESMSVSGSNHETVHSQTRRTKFHEACQPDEDYYERRQCLWPDSGIK